MADAKISPGKSPLTTISVIILFPLEHFFDIQTQTVIGHCYSIAVKLRIKVLRQLCTVIEEILIVSFTC